MFRKLATTGIAAAAVLGWATPAFAHVTVNPNEATKGATDQLISFQVPNEEDTATTKVEIVFPTDPPIVGVAPENTPGWTAKVTTQKLDTPIQTDDGAISNVVSDITWTADEAASGIQPETFQSFTVLAGELPDEGSEVVFKAVQTYANGDVVRWVDPVTPDGPEADFPTPIMTLGEGATGGGVTSTTVATGSAGGSVQTAQDDADTAKTIGIVAIVFSVVALLGVGIALFMRRKPASS